MENHSNKISISWETLTEDTNKRNELVDLLNAIVEKGWTVVTNVELVNIAIEKGYLQSDGEDGSVGFYPIGEIEVPGLNIVFGGQIGDDISLWGDDAYKTVSIINNICYDAKGNELKRINGNDYVGIPLSEGEYTATMIENNIKDFDVTLPKVEGNLILDFNGCFKDSFKLKAPKLNCLTIRDYTMTNPSKKLHLDTQSLSYLQISSHDEWSPYNPMEELYFNVPDNCNIQIMDYNFSANPNFTFKNSRVPVEGSLQFQSCYLDSFDCDISHMTEIPYMMFGCSTLTENAIQDVLDRLQTFPENDYENHPIELGGNRELSELTEEMFMRFRRKGWDASYQSVNYDFWKSMIEGI